MENEKLKTLKDLQLCCVYDDGDDEEPCTFAKEVLRAEAVKRVKYAEERFENANNELDRRYWDGYMTAIIEANDLTEEDLK